MSERGGPIELNSNIEGCWRVGRCWWDKKTAALWPPELRAKHPGPLAVPLKRERSQRRSLENLYPNPAMFLV